MKAIITLFLLSISCYSYGQELDVIIEKYDNNALEWPVGTNGKRSYSIENGKYIVYSKDKKLRHCVFKNFLVDRHKNFSLEASIKNTKGKKISPFGLLIGYSNWSNYAAFEIDKNNKFSIYQVRNGRKKFLAEDRKLGFKLSSGFNTLELRKENGNYGFYVNNNKIGSYRDLNFIGTGFGYILSGEQVIEVDQFQLFAMNLNVEIAPMVNGQLENLGGAVNSQHTEKGPIVSADGKTLYFTLKGDPNMNIGSNKKDDAVWAKLDARGNWTQRSLLPGEVNNAAPNFMVSIAPDENHAFFGNVYQFNGPMLSGLSESYRIDGNWLLPEKVVIKGFKNENNMVNYCVANSGRVLLMAIENTGSFGGLDLFVSFLDPDFTWSVPMNCGTVLNTFANDMTPFLSADDKTLYFSSAGHKGFGSNDIFISKRLDDSWTNWSKPVNLGKPVNGPGWDAYFKVDARGEYGYLVSSREGGYGNEDIYRVQLAKEIRPEEVVLIQGNVFDSESGEELSAKVYFEDLTANVSLGNGYAQKPSGYGITLPKGRYYGFQAELEGYIPVYQTIEVYELSAYKTLQVNLYLTPIKNEQEFELSTVTLEGDSLAKTSYYELDKLAETLKKNESLVIDLNAARDALNKEAEKQQNVLTQYLLKKGVNPSQLQDNKVGVDLSGQAGKILMNLKKR